jgi:hypothetical protein
MTVEASVVPTGSAGTVSSTGVFSGIDPIGAFQENASVPSLLAKLSATSTVHQRSQY